MQRISSLPQLIAAFEVQGQTVQATVTPELGPPVGDVFFARYDNDVSLAAVDEDLLTVPFVLNIAPVVWLSGRTFRVRALDQRLSRGLAAAREHFRRLYPQAGWDGNIVAERAVTTPATGKGPTRAAVLFSGGVDSTFTSLRHGGLTQTLVPIRGNDIAVDNDEGWAAVVERTRRFAADHGHRVSTITSNFRTFFDASRCAQLAGVRGWWEFVQHGLGLLGLAAPLVDSAGCSQLLISATRTNRLSAPWGSSPALDASAAWSGIEVGHYGYDWSRQEKLRYIVDRVTLEDMREPYLRVCYRRKRGPGGNCCRCEKCLRTATGLLLERADPRSFGFDLTPAQVERRTRKSYRERRFTLSEGGAFMWEDLQRRAREVRPDRPKIDRYLDWLLHFDLEAYRQELLDAASR